MHTHLLSEHRHLCARTHTCISLCLNSPHLLIFFSIYNLVTAATEAFCFSCAGKADSKLNQNFKIELLQTYGRNATNKLENSFDLCVIFMYVFILCKPEWML